MRIVHVLSQTQLTGAETYAVTLAEQQQAAGHTVTLISDQLHTSTSVPFQSWSVDRPKGWQKIRNWFLFRQFLVKNKIDIIHCHSRAAIRMASIARFGLPVALISTIHGRQHFSWSKRLWDRYGDKVIAVCENLRQHLLNDLRMNPRKIQVIANPFGTRPPMVSSGPFKISLIGRWSGPKAEKFYELLEKVFPSLLEQHPQLQLDLVGPQVQTNSIVESLQRKFPNRVHVLGFVDLNNYWPQTQFVVAAGRVAIEALAHGKTVFGLGEAEWLGEITFERLPEAMASNFGDIGVSAVASPLQMDLILKDLQAGLALQKKSATSASIQKKILEEYFSTSIFTQIERLYESALFQRKFPKWIPILMYHQVVDAVPDSPHKIFVQKENFEKHLQFFKNSGFTTLTFQDLSDFRKGRKSFSDWPAKPLILTFDDGYKNNLDFAVPLLEKYQTKAVFYLLADLKVQTNEWDHEKVPLLSASERKALAQKGFEIGSHGFTHQKINSMTEEAALHELVDSKLALEKELNTSVCSFAFTYGVTDWQAGQWAQKAGYEYALNTDTGGLHLEENPYQIFRVNVFPHDGPSQLKKKTSSWYRRYYFWKRGK